MTSISASSLFFHFSERGIDLSSQTFYQILKAWAQEHQKQQIMAPLTFPPSLFLGVILSFVTKILSSPMTMAFNQHYLKAESFSIDTSQSFQNSSTVSWNPLIYRISYAQAFPSVSNLSVVIATDNMDVIHSGGSIQFRGKVTSQEESHLVFNFESNFSSFIKNLGYRYLILINSYSQSNSNLIIESYSLLINLGINDSSPVERSVPYDSSLLRTANNTIFIPFLTGVDISTTSSSNALDINLNAEGNYTFINFLITSSLIETTFVKSLHFYLMIYDQDYYNRDQYASFHFGQLSGIAGAGPLNYVNTGNVYGPNVMVGVSGFSFSTQTHSDFSITFTSPNELTASSSVSSCLLNLNYLIMKTFFCDQLATYQRQIINQSLSSENLIENTCTPCPYDCQTCDIKGNCLSCNSLSDHRQLESNISRCIPQPGFYQSNVTAALKCGDGCTQCSSLNLCSACEQGFTPKYGLCALIICPPRTFLDSSECQQCPFDCLTCNSEGDCLSCSERDHRVFDNVSRCVPEGGFYEANRRVSYACPPGCISCNGMSICFDCLTDYELVQAKCQIMVSTKCDKTGKNCSTNISLILGVTLGPLGCCGLILCYFCKGKGGSVSPA